LYGWWVNSNSRATDNTYLFDFDPSTSLLTLKGDVYVVNLIAEQYTMEV